MTIIFPSKHLIIINYLKLILIGLIKRKAVVSTNLI